jgi:hypothetical protein
MKLNEIKTHEDLQKYVEDLFHNDADFYAGFYRGYCAAMKWDTDINFIYSLMDVNDCYDGVPI